MTDGYSLSNIVTQQAINALMCNERKRLKLAFTPTFLLPTMVDCTPSHVKHFALPMVHHVTGKTISSYKKLMNDLATSKVWQTAFGKDFGAWHWVTTKLVKKGQMQCLS